MSREESLSRRLAFLDVARGLAAMAVLVEHMLGPHIPGYQDRTVVDFSLGRIGVALFLVISGFIIPLSLERGGSNARFWLRRFFRLFPAYWLSIALFALYSQITHEPSNGVAWNDTRTWLINLTMLQGFFGVPDVVGVFWTLKIELVLYAICSLLFALGLSKHMTLIAIGLLVIYAVTGLLRPPFQGKPLGIGGQKFLYWTPIIGFLAQRYLSGAISRRAMYGLLAGHMFSLVAIWVEGKLLFPEEMKRKILVEFLVTWGSAYACFFVLLELRRFNMPNFACWLGRVSFSVYLLHPLALMVVPKWPLWIYAPVSLVVILIVSELSYRLVELPGIALGRKLELRLWPKPAVAESATPTSGEAPKVGTGSEKLS